MVQSDNPVIEVQEKAGKKDYRDVNQRWWMEKDSVLYEHVYPLVQAIEMNQQRRRFLNWRLYNMYSGYYVYGLNQGQLGSTTNDLTPFSALNLNATKSAVDTLIARISKNKPRVQFVTTNGDDKTQRKAKKLTMFLDGQFDKMKLYPEMQRSFKDCCIKDIGAVKFYKDEKNKTVKCERVIPEELVVDANDARYGRPQTIHQVKFISRDSLKEMFMDEKEAVEAIESCSTIRPQQTGSSSLRTTDLIRVTESWKLSSKKGVADGKHAICIENKTLFSESYDKDYFPFVFHRYTQESEGFYAQSAVQEVLPIQNMVTDLARRMQQALHLVAVPRIFLENNSMVNTQHINNDIGSIVKFTGSPPVFHTAPSLPPDLYQTLENLYQKIFNQLGVSQLSAQGIKPAGLNSAVALREQQDIEQDKFSITAQQYEDSFLDASVIVIDMMKELSEKFGDIDVNTMVGSNMERIKWKDVELDETAYVMRKFPTNILPTQPSGRLQTIQELIQSGFIDQKMGASLLDFPDLPAAMSLQNAPHDIIVMIISDILENSSYTNPEPFMDLDLSAKMMQLAYLRARTQNVSENKKNLMLRFITECKALKDKAMQAMQPQAGATPATGQAPIAVPPPPPRSDLVPLQTAQG